jgi:putative transposase
MGWKKTCAMDERMRFVMAVEEHDEAFAAVCRRFGVSRKTGYKWLERYGDGGAENLVDRSRAPLHHPQALTEEIAERCVAVRHAHPSWGPVKVQAWLEAHRPRTAWPAPSTIGALFDRAGLTVSAVCGGAARHRAHRLGIAQRRMMFGASTSRAGSSPVMAAVASH